MKKFFLTFSFFLVSFTFLQAQTWNGNNSSDWSDGGNWSTGTVPSTFGNVIIPGSGITNWPTLAANTIIGSLTMQSGSELEIGFSLSITGAGPSALALNGATITNNTGNPKEISITNGSSSVNGCSFEGSFNFDLSAAGQTHSGGNAAANTFTGDIFYELSNNTALSLSENFASTYDGELYITRATGSIGSIQLFGAGGLVTDNFTYETPETGSVGGIFRMGNIGVATTIQGSIAISAVRQSTFSMYDVTNEVNGDDIYISEHTGMVNMQGNSLQVGDFFINAYIIGGDRTATIQSNSITAVTIDISNQSVNPLYIGNNTFDGEVTISKQYGNAYDGWQQPNVYLGDAYFNTNVAVSYNDTSTFYKNITVDFDQQDILNGTSSINGLKFKGSENSEFSQLGSGNIAMERIIMDKTGSAQLTLNGAITVTKNVHFGRGNIYTSAANPLKFDNQAIYSNLSDDSHVVGQVIKTGLGFLVSAGPPPYYNFPFPLGTDNTLNTVTMSTFNESDTYSAEYFFKNPTIDGYDISQHANTLEWVSGCEYWNIQRIGTASVLSLGFHFGLPCMANPPYIDDDTKARIAHWTGSTWENLGNDYSNSGFNVIASPSGTGISSGNVYVDNVNNFGPFTFGYVNQGTLPVKFGNVKAYQQGSGIKIDWSNLTESNVRNYKIERSADGINFSSLSSLPATKNNGGRAGYSYFDARPVTGVNFYRIQTTETDGKKLYSVIVKVNTKGTGSNVTIYPNPVTDGRLVLQAPELEKGVYKIVIFNNAGQQVYKTQVIHAGGFVTQSFQLPVSVPAGIYILQLRGRNSIITKTFIVQ